jgi:hypothetical protein
MQAVKLFVYKASQSEAKGDFSRLKTSKLDAKQAATTHHTLTTGLMMLNVR